MLIVQCNATQQPSEYYGPFENKDEFMRWMVEHRQICDRPNHHPRMLRSPALGILSSVEIAKGG